MAGLTRLIQRLGVDRAVTREGFKEAIGETDRVVRWGMPEEVPAHQAMGGIWTHCGWESGDLNQKEIKQAVRRLTVDEEGKEKRLKAAAFKDRNRA
ncbi:hypothetical protein BT93_J1453 [Corymbia citriodora subsp. variegata]|nr:hypothetical protein BT93_J1453 [Corymbia citriodora subsp. variegata]